MNTTLFTNIVASTALVALTTMPMGCQSINSKGQGQFVLPGFLDIVFEWDGTYVDGASDLPEGVTLCRMETDEGTGFKYCIYKADCDDPMSETWVDLHCDARHFEKLTPRKVTTNFGDAGMSEYRSARLSYDGDTDVMNLSMVTDVNLTPLEVREHGLSIEVTSNITPASTQLQNSFMSGPLASGQANAWTLSLVGSSQSVVNHIASFGIDYLEFEARDGRTYQLEREGVLPLYNLYIGDVVVDSIWVD